MSSKLLLSAFMDDYDDDIDVQIRFMKEHNIHYLELRHANGKNVSEFDDEFLLQLKEKLNKADIKLSSIGSPIGKVEISSNLSEHFALAERICYIAKMLNCQNVRVFSFYPPKGEKSVNYKVEVFNAMEKLIAIADKYNVTLCHENEAKIYGESPESCLELLEHFKGKLKAVFDMGNFTLDGYEAYPYAYNLLLPYIEYFHIKDALKVGAIVPPGKGEANINEILSDFIRHSNKNVFITLEPHLQTFSGLNALVGKKFDNPYKYNSQQEAFIDALNKINVILENKENKNGNI